MQLDSHLRSTENKNNLCAALKGKLENDTKCFSTCVDLLCFISAVMLMEQFHIFRSDVFTLMVMCM